MNKLITLQKETDTRSKICINDEITDDNNTSEEISCHQEATKVLDHKCYDNGNNVLNIEKEAIVTSIHYINTINEIYMNYDGNYMHKYYELFSSSNNHEDFLLDQNMIKRNVCCNKNYFRSTII